MKYPILFYFILLTTFFSCQGQEDPALTPPPGPINPALSYHGIGHVGSLSDVQTTSETGLVLMGGSTDVDEAIKWMITKSGGGDFIILRASGSTGYNEYIFGLGTVNSVETLLLDSRTKADKQAVGNRIREAEAVFIAGGDQADYVNYWSDTEVSKALNYLINEKKVPIGGTSAGCAILSEYIFDAKQGSVISSEALANPYNNLVSVSKSFFDAPFLKNTIADQHYSQRQRKGRHVTFMARMQKDMAVSLPKGIGVDERTAVCITKEGDAVVFGSGSAFFIQGNANGPEVCVQSQALTWDLNDKAIKVTSIQGSTIGTPAFNLTNWPSEGTTHWYVENGVLQTGK